MGYRLSLLCALVAAACGNHPSPAPTPVPAPITVHATLTDTVSGATIGGFDQIVTSLPARVTLTATGHLDRTLSVSSATPTVDLIPDAAPFDLTFYRQFARNALDTGSPDVLRVLSQAPSIYLQTAGLTAANVAALEQAARDVIPALTGGRFQLAAWETGTDLRADAPGWITVQIVNSPDPCGRASIGGSAGHIWLNIAARCAFGGYTVYPMVLAHETGHALGFGHVSAFGSLMHASGAFEVSQPSAAERYHAAIAYHRSAGNRDVDVD